MIYMIKILKIMVDLTKKIVHFNFLIYQVFYQRNFSILLGKFENRESDSKFISLAK